jgi:hypothetical protein
MEGGIYFPYTARPQGPPVLDEGWTGSQLTDLPQYPPYPQIIAEARHLIRCDAPPLYQLIWIFSHIPLFSILLYSLVPFRESVKEVGQHALKTSYPRYEGLSICSSTFI